MERKDFWEEVFKLGCNKPYCNSHETCERTKYDLEACYSVEPINKVLDKHIKDE